MRKMDRHNYFPYRANQKAMPGTGPKKKTIFTSHMQINKGSLY